MSKLLEKWTPAIAVAIVVAMFAAFIVIAAPNQRSVAAPFTIARQVAQVRSAVVHVYKENVCQGSGCLISPDGIIFSAKHVSDNTPGEYTVTLDDGRTFSTKYVVEDKENDISFLQLDLEAANQEPNLPHATLATAEPQVGDGLIIGGSPLGRENFNTFSFGILSATNRDLVGQAPSEATRYTWHVMLQTTSPAYPGNSGGPVFNMQGEVVGVLVAGADATLNWAVPVARFAGTIDTVRRWFELCRFDVVEGEPPAQTEWPYDTREDSTREDSTREVGHSFQ